VCVPLWLLLLGVWPEWVLYDDHRWGNEPTMTRPSLQAIRQCSCLQGKAHGHAEVLKCLVKNYKGLNDTCQTEMSRAVRMALWEYKRGMALTGRNLEHLGVQKRGQLMSHFHVSRQGKLVGCMQYTQEGGVNSKKHRD
jgi:hypothetical protein